MLLLGEDAASLLAPSAPAFRDVLRSPVAEVPESLVRVVRDLTGSCGLPAAGAAEDGTDVIKGWTDLGEAFKGVTIKSITDASNATVGVVMFNSIGASVNTCASVSFPITIVLEDTSGQTRTLEITSAGSIKLR